MIADLHCHYPMHLLPKDRHPHHAAKGWLKRLKDDVDARAVGITAATIQRSGVVGRLAS